LSFPSCRIKVILADKTRQKRLDEKIERTLILLLEKTEKLYITGSGDPFGSNHLGD
jgi:hypothetical protein